MLDQGDLDGRRVWLDILEKVKELQRVEPGSCTEARCGGSLLHSGVLRSECPLSAVFLLLHPQHRTESDRCLYGKL